MKRLKPTLVAFAILAAAQLAVVGWLVAKGVSTAGRHVIELDVELADPIDPMRGRYLALGYGFERLSRDDFPETGDAVEQLRQGDTVFIVFEKEGGRDEYAYASAAKPDDEHVFIKSTVENPWPGMPADIVVRPCVDRYYIREDLAVTADKLLRDGKDRVMRVRISVDREGDARIDRFTVDGDPVERYVEQHH